MRIRSVEAERYAGINGLRAEFPPGLSVVVGDNESGKSSLMEFIRSGLFPAGYNKKRYPRPDKDHRGSVMVEMEDGSRKVIEREGAKLRDRDGGPLPHDLFHGMDIETYESMFAIGLADLSRSGALGRMRGRIVSDAGARNLPGAFSSLSSATEAMMGKRKSAKSDKALEVLYNTIEEKREEVRALEERVEGFDALVAERERLAEHLDSLKGEMSTIDKELLWLNKLNEQRENWVKLRDCEEAIVRLQDSEGFPAGGEERLKELKSKLEELRSKRRTLAGDIGRLERELEGVSVDEGLLSRAEELRRLAANLSIYRDGLKEIPLLTETVERKERERRKESGRLDWDEDRIMEADVSISFMEKGKRADRVLSDIDEGISALRLQIVDAESQATEGPGDPPSLPPDPQEEKGRLREAEALQRGVERAEQRPLPPDRSPPAVAAAALMAVLAAAGALSGETLLGLGGAAGAAVLFGYGLWSRRERSRRSEERSRAIDQAVASLCALLPEGVPADRDGLDAWREGIDQRIRGYSEAQSLLRRHEELSEDAAAKRQRLAGLRERLEALEVQKGEAQETWEDALRGANWPHYEEPELVPLNVSVIEKVRSLKDDIDEARGRLEAKKAAVAEYEEEVAAVARELSRDSGDTVQTVHRLEDELERAESSKQRADGHRERIAQMEDADRAAEAEETRAAEEMDALLSPYGGEEEFISMAERSRELKAAREEEAVLRRSLTSTAGNPESFERMVEAMVRMDRSEAEQRAAALQQQRDELERERDGTQAELGRTEGEIEGLKVDDRLARAREELADAEANMEALIRRWATLKLADGVLRKACDEFERDKQPEVVKKAEGYLRLMTGKELDLIAAGEGGIVVHDRHARKEEDMWSSGLGDQVQLSLRLALARAMGAPEPLPMILDDVLVRFDPSRREGAAKAIAAVAAEQQVLFFTCDAAVADVFRRIEAGAEHMRIAGGKVLVGGEETVL